MNNKNMQRAEWNKKVVDSFKDKSQFEITTHREHIEDIHSVNVHSLVFNLDQIRYNLPKDMRDRAQINMIQVSESEFTCAISQRYRSFRTEFVGSNIFGQLLEDDIEFKDSIPDDIEWTVSSSGLKLSTDTPEVVSIFPTESTRLCRLYKAYKDSSDKYVYIYRQMGGSNQTELEQDRQRLNNKRVASVLYNSSLNCDLCSERDTVEYKPHSDYSKGFNFVCSSCGAIVPASNNLHKDLDGGECIGYLRLKIKQEYKTAVGSPSQVEYTDN